VIAKSQNEARRASLALFQRAISCISKAVIERGHSGEGVADFWSLENRYIPLGGRDRLEFSFYHPYAVHQSLDAPVRSVVHSSGYFYQVREQTGQKVIAFHWHPGRRGQPDFPHLHVTSHVGGVHISAKSHVPTGRVSLESVVRFLIEELHVRPLRRDWEQVLEEGERHFHDRRSW
jgi:hypothetical protein